MSRNAALGLGMVLLVLGLLSLLKLLVVGGSLMLILALGLVAAHLMRITGRWALVAAAVLILLSVPYMFVGAMRFALVLTSMAFRLIPLALAAVGLYVLVRAFGR